MSLFPDNQTGLMVPTVGPDAANALASSIFNDLLGLAVDHVQQQLSHFARSEAALSQLTTVFEASQPTLQSVLSDWATGEFQYLPTLTVLPDTAMNGAQGAFSVKTNTIYLATSLVNQDVSLWADPLVGIEGVIVEEIGHSVDELLHPGIDTQGDEGELLKSEVLGYGLTAEQRSRIRVEDDHSTVIVDGYIIPVEQATIQGNNWNNTLKGTSTGDSLYGYDGNDYLYGYGSNDQLYGGNGNDYLDGGYGFDIIDGGSGTDTVSYSFYSGSVAINFKQTYGNVSFPGNSTQTETVRSVENYIGSSGNDTVYGNYGNNVLRSNNGADRLYGDSGNDYLYGENNNDTLYGNSGNDYLDGGSGNDRLDAYGFNTYERDRLVGGSGTDQFILGTSSQTYYAKNGNSDYATIQDFYRYGDKIQLQKLSSAAYSSSRAYGYNLYVSGNDTWIRRDNDGEAIAVIMGQTGLNLTSTQFAFLGTPPASKPDLVVQSASVPTSVTTGDSVSISAYTKNMGGSTAGYSYTRYWLSNDTTLDSGDRFLDYDYVGNLSAGASEYDTHSFTYDASWGTGTKYILFEADTDDTVEESNENNNVTAKAITINAPVQTNSFNIEFDYRFDTNGWFTAEKKAALEAAASIWENIIQDEFTDVPIGTNLRVRNPQTEVMTNLTADYAIDDLVIFVGAYDMASLGVGGPSATYYLGSDLENRYTGSDFEPWTGSVSFNSNPNWSWYFDSTPLISDSIPSGQSDFVSVAVHEIGHVLGIGTSNAFDSLVSLYNGKYYFNGNNTKNQNGGYSLPLASDQSHIEEGYSYGVYGEAAMDPIITVGDRKLVTRLDAALLDDIGYTIDYTKIYQNS